jgi:septation ring formation regulator EzrA
MQNSELVELHQQFEKARERYESVGESFIETRSEYYNQINYYGDAWIGARGELDRMYRAFGEAEEKYKALQAKLPPVQGCEWKHSWEYEEVPF